jgi:hypothetical protein
MNLAYIFIVHSDEQATGAARIRADLRKAGYSVSNEAQHIPVSRYRYARTIENGILRSAAIIVIWSAAAEQDEWVERKILFAQQLKKPIFTVQTDSTSLSNRLVARAVNSDPSCVDMVATLLPQLPPAGASDVQQVAEMLAQEKIGQPEEGIERATTLLAKGEHREVLLAMLEHVARRNLMSRVREKAQSAIDRDSKKDDGSGGVDESRHMFAVRCPKGHVTYFDRRVICKDEMQFVRSMVRAGVQVDAMHMQCGECSDGMIVSVDCGAYK